MMTVVVLVLAMSQPAVAPPQGFVALEPAASADNAERLCTADRRWCVVPPEPEDATIYVDAGTSGPAYWSPPEGDGSTYSLIPAIAPLKAGGSLLLMEAKRAASYSGGGGAFKDWVVLHVAPAGEVTRVLTAPKGGNLEIRACFSEGDAAQRAGACHDQYEMTGAIALDDDGSVMPPIRLSTEARSFPRSVRRDADSLSSPPLKAADLVWTADAVCTYQRVFSYSFQAKEYVADTPLPDCSQYLEQ